MTTATKASHYTIISADTHAGASHETYRKYLDSGFLEDFDAWRSQYKNPWKGLRGGVLLPNVAPDVKWVKPLYDPEYDRLWAALQDMDIVVNLHGGTGSPDYGRYPATPLLLITEVSFYGLRPFVHMLLSGVFE